MRKKLFGHEAAAGDFAKVIADLYLGDPNRGILPLPTSQIMVKLGFKELKSIKDLKKLAIELSYLSIDKNGKAVLPKKSVDFIFTAFNEKHQFKNHPKVQAWMKNLSVRKNGKPLKSSGQLLAGFTVVCNTLETDPQQWIIGANTNEVLESGRVLMTEFMELYKKKKAKLAYSYNWSVDTANLDAVRYSYAKCVRDFMAFNHFRYPDGEKGIMAQSIASFHGNFSDVRLTTDELEKANDWIIRTEGIDSDLYRAFWVGIESCCRKTALHKMKSNFLRHQSKKTNMITFIMEAFETKTEHIRGGKWVKYIQRQQTQESIEQVHDRGSGYVIENTREMWKFQDVIGGKLKELYRFLGKEKVHLANQDDDESGYFMNHAFHSLRHIGAHFWLEKTKYHYGFVAKIGGWNNIQELKDSYGEMPPDFVLDMFDSGFESMGAGF